MCCKIFQFWFLSIQKVQSWMVAAHISTISLCYLTNLYIFTIYTHQSAVPLGDFPLCSVPHCLYAGKKTCIDVTFLFLNSFKNKIPILSSPFFPILVFLSLFSLKISPQPPGSPLHTAADLHRSTPTCTFPCASPGTGPTATAAASVTAADTPTITALTTSSSSA